MDHADTNIELFEMLQNKFRYSFIPCKVVDARTANDDFESLQPFQCPEPFLQLLQEGDKLRQRRGYLVCAEPKAQIASLLIATAIRVLAAQILY